MLMNSLQYNQRRAKQLGMGYNVTNGFACMRVRFALVTCREGGTLAVFQNYRISFKNG